MPTEAPRCIDCGTPLKAVPAWLATAHVSFTCTACPRRSSRATARYEPALEPRVSVSGDADPEIEGVDLEDLDEETELDLGAGELDEIKDDKDV